MGTGDSYLERPGAAWSVVYGLHLITLFHCLKLSVDMTQEIVTGITRATPEG